MTRSRSADWAIVVALSNLLLVACGTTPRQPEATPGVYGTHGAAKDGGYYKDDGPGENPPDIDAIEDAEPRLDPLNRFANNPYSVEGRLYTPMRSIRPFTQRGLASWYGRRFNGQRTSSGETYDMYGMTAAHPTLPIPSYAKVTNLQNGRSVVVRVNDRGPFLSNRVIDLSYTAAAKLGYVGSGSATVELELIQPQDMQQYAHRGPRAVLAAQAPAGPRRPAFSLISSAQAAEPAASDAGEIYLQLGAFSSRKNAEGLRARAARELSWLKDFIVVLEREGAYRVQAGPYRNRGDAADHAKRIREALQLDPIFVPR